MNKNSTKKSMKLLRFALGLLFLGILAVGWIYYMVWAPKDLWDKEVPSKVLYIQDGERWTELQSNVDTICPNLSQTIFRLLGKKMNLHRNIHPGRYEIEKNQSTIEFIRRLRSGEQNPILVTIPEIKSIREAIVFASRTLQMDSLTIEGYLNQDDTWKDKPHWILPNTYEMYWNVSPEKYMQRLYKEGKAFWNHPSQTRKLEKLNLSPFDAYILASIVNRETNHFLEMDTIAGVYYNRLQINMPLQADPTIQYLLPPGVKRVLYKDLEIDSPFNTYKYTGLPPAPIGLASMKSIQSVLNLEQHDYLYFCANPDRPGTHSFARTYNQHLENARKYHRSLN